MLLNIKIVWMKIEVLIRNLHLNISCLQPWSKEDLLLS